MINDGRACMKVASKQIDPIDGTQYVVIWIKEKL